MTNLKLTLSFFTICWLSLTCNSYGQTPLEDSLVTHNFDSYSRYAVGLSAQIRQAAPTAGLGVEQSFWRTYGAGLSALRYTNKRLYWTVGLNYTVARENQERTLDIRFIFNPDTGQYEQQELGTKTEVWKYRYFSVPVGLNHLLFDTKSTNMYVAGSVIFDWLYRHKREVDATYDGRFDVISAGRFADASVSLRGGIGLYQPIGSRFILTTGPYVGYSFLSDFEKAQRVRGNHSIFFFDIKLYYRLP